jgi:(E)-4-hydroxy-3-methylbut-2-enyl-diphosphate synthase
MPLRYVPDPFVAVRRATREVRVGEVGIGGANPVRIQSMTTTDTRDTLATADQVEGLADAGCEIVRVTAPSIRDAENLKEIAGEIRRRGLSVPLVADIHFTPNAAMIAAEHVEKVRINPGNYADKKKFEIREYSDAEYAEELERVADRFRPLVRRCRQRGVVLRIGTNHGSLSDRIMNRYGDTPLGMVESALEFLDVCEDEGFRELVFSMKSSNPQVAIQAYRLLAARLAGRGGGPGYPFHLGVTEAGDGEDGCIKSAIGIGSLLEDGIGDTIRVSLTADPVEELPVAAALARRAEARWARDAGAAVDSTAPTAAWVDDPFAHARRETKSVRAGGLDLGGAEPVRVELDLGPLAEQAEALASALATSLALFPELACEGLLVDAEDAAGASAVGVLRTALGRVGLDLPLALRVPPWLASGAVGEAARLVVPVDPESEDADLVEAARATAGAGLPLEWCLRGEVQELPGLVDRALAAASAGGASGPLFSVECSRATHAVRVVVARLRELGAGDHCLILRHRRDARLSNDEALIEAAIDLGAPLCDGIGDAVSLAGFDDAARAVDRAYRILQGARLRTTRTEYISCPSCGRTLFDLEETTARVKAATGHLRGVKIAVMGCIVNGPGEMADADFGYVGSGPGQVMLYAGKQVVERNVPGDRAPERLVELIRQHGRWVDPD